jgi:hypothetical protein
MGDEIQRCEVGNALSYTSQRSCSEVSLLTVIKLQTCYITSSIIGCTVWMRSAVIGFDIRLILAARFVGTKVFLSFLVFL